MATKRGAPVFSWLVSWTTAFVFWLLFVNTTKPHELWMAAWASALAAIAYESVRRQPFARLRPRVHWVIQAWREPWYIVEGCSSIFASFFKQLFKTERSVLREVVFEAGGDDPASTARRALAMTYTTIPPNFVVLGIDVAKNVMLVHQVTQTETPTLTRNLGAKS